MIIWKTEGIFNPKYSHNLVHCDELYEPRYEKTGFLHMQKQRRRSVAQ